MFIIVISSLLYYTGSCHVIPIARPTYGDELVKCVTEIVAKYFAPHKMLTYVGNKLDDDEFLKVIHGLNVVAMMSRRSSRKLPVSHEGYFISARNYSVFIDRFPNLATESTWKPDAPFLIIVRSLQECQLKAIFNRLLKQHVNNVIVVNGSADADLYSYNPFDKYACGKYYDDIISYGKCSQAHTLDLFPKKYVTGLRNCTFTVSISHSPPYTVIPPNDTDTTSSLSYGIEPYLLRLVGKLEGFALNIVLNREASESFSTVTSDMEAVGSLKMLQNNEADAVLGGLLLVPSRAVAFSYIYDFFPYVDEIRYLVGRATLVPAWKNVYLEFDSTVWMLIVLSLVFYSVVMAILLRVEDKSHVVLKLLDNLVLHGSNIHCQSTVKCVFIIWVWAAYLINTFYQSSLVSLTTNPAYERQISTEGDILLHKLKPCFSEVMGKYYIESTQSHSSNYTPVPGCKGLLESVNTVINSKEHFTIFLYGLYMYNRQDFLNSYGNSRIYSVRKPYSKVIYCMFFYKGFPIIHQLRMNALRLREMGLVDKAVSDMIYLKKIKRHFHARKYGSRFVIPWRVYIFGCILATVTLVLEILSKNNYY